MIGSSQYSLDTPRLSPDGSWIAVTAVHQRDARAQIFAIPLEGGKPAPEEAWVAITDGDSWDDKPVWTARAMRCFIIRGATASAASGVRQSINPPKGPRARRKKCCLFTAFASP